MANSRTKSIKSTTSTTSTPSAASTAHGAGAPDTMAVLTGMYAAEAKYLAAGGPGEASFDLLAPYFSTDVVLRQADWLPYGGVWRGHAGMERFFVAMSRVWAAFDMVEQEFLATGATAVVRTRVHAVARTTGRELAFPILQTIKVAHGRITEVDPFYWDTGAVADLVRADG